MTDKPKAPVPGQDLHAHAANPPHLPEGVKPAPGPRRGFDPAAIRGKGGKGFGDRVKPIPLPGKSRGR